MFVFSRLLSAITQPLFWLALCENRYRAPAAEAIDRHVGIIVLGGAVGHPSSYAAHGQVPPGEAAERMTVPVGLMRQHPRLELVFSGGEGRLLATGVTESDLARVFYEQQGLDMARVLEAHREDAHPARGLALHQRHDRGRIHAAAQEGA